MELTWQLQGPSLQSPQDHRHAACRWWLWTESEQTAWWTSVCWPETGSRTYEAMPVEKKVTRQLRTDAGHTCLFVHVMHGLFTVCMWQLRLEGRHCYNNPGTSHCLMSGESIWGVKRESRDRNQMASINITTFLLAHSCAFSSLTAKMRRREEELQTGTLKGQLLNCISLL